MVLAGDCWVLAALGALTVDRQFLAHLLPNNQGFKMHYSGIFHFRFWQFGEWVDVVIDDRLPFLHGKYLCVQPRSSNEFWPSLLEKAYAKLKGSYQNLHSGFISEAFVDFTGGVNLGFSMRNDSFDLQNILRGAAKSNSLMASIIYNSEGSDQELENGLVAGHAYTLTGIKKVSYMNGWEYLIRLWNPWGSGEWNGRWSDKSREWEKIDVTWRKRLNIPMEDGEFWMSLKDFEQHFDHIYICNLTPIFLEFNDPPQPWRRTMYVGPWIKGSMESRGLIYETIFKNPPCLVTVRESDRFSTSCNVLASLIQKPCGRQIMLKRDTIPAYIMIQKVDPKILEDGLPNSFLYQSRTEDLSSDLIALHDVSFRGTLNPGTYLLIPYFMRTDRELDFILRVYQRSTDYADEVNNSRAEDMPTFDSRITHDDTYENIFARYCNKTSEIEASQLQKLLNEVVLKDESISVKGEGFSLDACRAILLLMDLNVNGKLNLKEFKSLWKHLDTYKNLFRENDLSSSGSLNISSLQNAVEKAGFQVSHAMLKLMVLRYGDSERINFSSFVCCMIRFEMVTKAFRNLNKDGRGVYVGEEDWLQIIMSS
uniref:Calpain-1 catalytic subunit-like isoform X2 n=1 Tax=Geotrypetes seraphini TaxID=260995 RepID=A0A6P8QH45_GEOSA|nr:calpain-1 catalytic subunit-like isoform X2 [Geotrypetes seraphini]